ncbi:RIO1-domain-containing protein [Polychaeton citri CBS 116435]|uniref:Serine/threonine-protein kinase RIO2 n=1 Tax=Polychaeton citri CBS 116435 TaxID=1314669 RepID=A0A9P4QAZ8_9PEZI|nr:RIO1-domain-containing protein [Polychaeton citri CBS 116435]
MKLNTSALRYLTGEDWRVLAAVEQGSKNHEVVPTPLIQQIAGSKINTGVHRCISNLAKVGLIAKVKNARYDGYRLTYGGLDYLALNSHRKGNTIYSLGNQIGVGKESDIYVVADADGRQLVLKLHRLGRISFRTVKSNRDYLRNRSTGSWMYLSRLAAQKEYAFMRVLHREGYPIPEPVGWSRHTVVMDFIDAFPMRMIDNVPHPEKLYADLMGLIVRLARNSLIHGDFNEFNILVKEIPAPTAKDPGALRLDPIMIDFPQMVSINHQNAEFYFDRDVAGIKRFFERRFRYTSDEPGPFFKDATKGSEKLRHLDIEVEASGFSKKMAKDLDRYVEQIGGDATEVETSNDPPGDDNEDSEDEGNEETEEAGAAVDKEEDFDLTETTANDADDTEGADRTLPDQQIVKSDLAQGLNSLTLDRFLNENDSHKDWGLQPLEITTDTEVIAENTRIKKKAAGWAI